MSRSESIFAIVAGLLGVAAAGLIAEFQVWMGRLGRTTTADPSLFKRYRRFNRAIGIAMVLFGAWALVRTLV